MSSLLLLAVAFATPLPANTPFGPAVDDAELAFVTAGRPAATASLAGTDARAGAGRGATAEQIDCWWADDGAAMIADAHRPVATMPRGLDLSVVAGGIVSLRYTQTVTAQTRP